MRLRIADDQPVHLGDRRFDEAERLGEILRELLVGAFEHGLGGCRSRCRASPARRTAARRKRCDPLEDIAAQFLELAGEAHDVDQRRAQIVADDVGEALDFVIGLAQIGGALVDRGLEIEIVVAQPCFGLVAGARRAPHQEDRDAGERDHEAGAGDGHDGGEYLACGRQLRCASRTTDLPRRAWRRRPRGWCRMALPAAASRTNAMASAASLRLTKFDARARIRRAALRSPCAAVLTFSTWTGLSPVRLGQLVGVGEDVRRRRSRTRSGIRGPEVRR